MKKRIKLTLLFLLGISAALFAQDRGLTLMVKQLGENNRAGRQYLLLIAIDNYQNWPPLKNPVKDARELKEILTTRYYIDGTIELYNDAAT
jgi:hypothetical protein